MTSPRVLLLCIACLVPLAGCGKVIDHKDLESKLSSYLQLEFGTRVGVSCPDGQAAKKGKTFSCTANAPKGAKVNVRVQFADDKGAFNVIAVTAAK